MKLSTPLKNYWLDTGSLKDGLGDAGTGCYIYIYAGPVPDTADEALDMTLTTGLHTQLAKLTDNNDGTTGLFFGTATSGALPKDAQTWLGLINFTGKITANGTLTPSFLRIVETADDPAAAVTTERRIQMTCAPTGAEVYVPDMTDNDVNTQGLNVFELRVSDLPF